MKNVNKNLNKQYAEICKNPEENVKKIDKSEREDKTMKKKEKPCPVCNKGFLKNYGNGVIMCGECHYTDKRGL